MAGSSDNKTTVGWREYVALPEWGIPRLRAKIDTGARTSAIHVAQIEELDNGHTKANSRVAESLFLQAVGAPAKVVDGVVVQSEQARVPSAAIWWSKARMGWKETITNENTGKDGAPIAHKVEWVVVDPKG